MHLPEAGFRNPLAGVKYLHPDHLILFVEVEHDPRLHFLGPNDSGIIQPEIKHA